MNTHTPLLPALGLLSRHVPGNRACRSMPCGLRTAATSCVRRRGYVLEVQTGSHHGRSGPKALRVSACPARAADLSSSKGTISALSRGMCQRLRIRRGAAVRARNHPVSVSFGPLVSVTATLAGFWMVQDRSRTAVVEVA